MAGLGRFFDFSCGKRMSIGIQNNNLAGAQGINGLGTQGYVTQQAQPSAIPQPATETQGHWLDSDLQPSASGINWNDFNIGPTDWENNLRGVYNKTHVVQQAGKEVNTGMGNWINNPHSNKNLVKINTGGMGNYTYVAPPQTGMTGATYSGEGPFSMGPQFKGAAVRKPVYANVSFKDPNLQRYVADIPSLVSDGAFGNVNAQGKKLDWNQANIDALSAKVGTPEQIQALAEKYGVGIDEVQGVYDRYNKARQAIIDPVGANWNDIKASPFYKDIQAGIQQYTNRKAPTLEKTSPTSFGYTPVPGYNKGKQVDFAKLNELGGDSPLTAEYFALHSANDRSGRNAYRLTDANDFMRPGMSNEQAQEAYLKQKDLLDNTVAKGGQFDYRREYTAAGGKTPKGYMKLAEGMSNNGYNEALDTSQNFLGFATNGEKSYHDAGFKDEAATKALFRKKPVKSGFLPGPLSTIATIASFIPGPWQVPARVALAMNSAAQGNPIGALTAAASFLPGANGVGLNPVGAALSSGGGKLASVLGGTLGDVGGKIASGALTGGLTGALSGNAVRGAVTGAVGQGVSQGAQSAGFDTKTANAIGTGLTGAGNVVYNYNKVRQMQQAAIQKQRDAAAAARAKA